MRCSLYFPLSFILEKFEGGFGLGPGEAHKRGRASETELLWVQLAHDDGSVVDGDVREGISGELLS